MHVTKHIISDSLMQPTKYGSKSMCPCVFRSLERSQKLESNTMNKTVTFTDNSIKQISSDLSYLGMT